MGNNRSGMTMARPEVTLLLLSARTQVDAQTARHVRELLDRELDWRFYAQLLARHRVTTLCYRQLQHFAGDGIPEAVLTKLHAATQQLSWHELTLLGELCKVMALFRKQQVRAIPFKGPVLSYMAYGDPVLRLCGDLDILVPEPQLGRAKELLATLGYLSDSTQVLLNAPESAVHHVYHHEIFTHKERQVTVELHWKVDECEFIRPFDPLFADDVCDTLTIGGSEMTVFSPESLLLLICDHGSKHQWWHLMWICDVAEFLRRHPHLNWQKIDNMAHASGNERVLLLGLLLANELLDAPVPDEYLQRARASRVIRKLLHEVQGTLEATELPGFISLDFLLFHIRAKERLWDRLKLFVHFTLLPGEEDWTVAPLPPALSFLHYLLRPFRLVQRYGFKCIRDKFSANSSR